MFFEFPHRVFIFLGSLLRFRPPPRDGEPASFRTDRPAGISAAEDSVGALRSESRVELPGRGRAGSGGQRDKEDR